MATSSLTVHDSKNAPGPKVALVGRPNVGKSTLFNRLIGRRRAIVDDIPGVTRDRQYGEVQWQNRHFTLIDTGGLNPQAKSGVLSRKVLEQAQLALSEAQVVLFVVDGRTGLTPAETEIGRMLHQSSRAETFVVVNKIDLSQHQNLIHDFHGLGFQKIFGVSAETRLGLSELLDNLVQSLQAPEKKPAIKADLKLTIVGQPNVGKSTLLNAFLGETRAVVHHEAGTTVDPLNTLLKKNDKLYEFIDTAGIKRRRSTVGKVEKVGVLKALESVRRSHLALLVVDATRGISAQDMKLFNAVAEKGRAMILVLNKWDLMPAESSLKAIQKDFEARFKRHQATPVIGISAKTQRGITKLFKLIDQVHENYFRLIGTGELNRVFQRALKNHPPPAVGGKVLHLNYISQSGKGPPQLTVFANHPHLIPEMYLRYLEKNIRQKFNFEGVSLKWRLKKK